MPAKERTVQFQLNHHCSLPEAAGYSGQIIECPESTARKLAERGGGKPVRDRQPEAATTDKQAE
jgi:hypothetical protein